MVIGPNDIIILSLTPDSTDGVAISKQNIIPAENYHTPVTSDVLRKKAILATLPKIVWLTLQNILQQIWIKLKIYVIYVTFESNSRDYLRIFFSRFFQCFTKDIVKGVTCDLWKSYLGHTPLIKHTIICRPLLPRAGSPRYKNVCRAGSGQPQVHLCT